MFLTWYLSLEAFVWKLGYIWHVLIDGQLLSINFQNHIYNPLGSIVLGICLSVCLTLLFSLDINLAYNSWSISSQGFKAIYMKNVVKKWKLEELEKFLHSDSDSRVSVDSCHNSIWCAHEFKTLQLVNHVW